MQILKKLFKLEPQTRYVVVPPRQTERQKYTDMYVRWLRPVANTYEESGEFEEFADRTGRMWKRVVKPPCVHIEIDNPASYYMPDDHTIFIPLEDMPHLVINDDKLMMMGTGVHNYKKDLLIHIKDVGVYKHTFMVAAQMDCVALRVRKVS